MCLHLQRWLYEWSSSGSTFSFLVELVKMNFDFISRSKILFALLHCLLMLLTHLLPQGPFRFIRWTNSLYPIGLVSSASHLIAGTWFPIYISQLPSSHCLCLDLCFNNTLACESFMKSAVSHFCFDLLADASIASFCHLLWTLRSWYLYMTIFTCSLPC